MSCTGGTPGAQLQEFSVFLNVNITNHLSGNTVTDVVFTVDNGSDRSLSIRPACWLLPINWSITG